MKFLELLVDCWNHLVSERRGVGCLHSTDWTSCRFYQLSAPLSPFQIKSVWFIQLKITVTSLQWALKSVQWTTSSDPRSERGNTSHVEKKKQLLKPERKRGGRERGGGGSYREWESDTVCSLWEEKTKVKKMMLIRINRLFLVCRGLEILIL